MFLSSAGHMEKAIASCQALIEFNLFRPHTLNLMGTKASAEAFEGFWDAGVARFGEKGARGWAAWFDENLRLSSAVPERGDLGKKFNTYIHVYI